MSVLRNVLFVAILIIAAAFVFAGMPQPTHAQTTVSTATTTSNNASTTLAKPGDIVSFQLNLNPFGSSPTSSPLISVLNLGTTTMTATATTSAWIYSTTTTTGWPEGNVTFTIDYRDYQGAATSTLISAASTTIRHVVFDKTAPGANSVVTIASNNASTSLAKAGDVITLSITSSEIIETPTVTIAGQAATESMVSASTTWTATYTVVGGDTNGSVSLSIAFTDPAGNSGTTETTITSGPSVYIDTTGPSISVTGTNPDTVGASSDSYSDAGATATDTHDGSVSVSTSGSVNRGVLGAQTITYTATDTAGNSSTATRTVTVSGGGGGGVFITAPGVTLAAPTVPGAASNVSSVTTSQGANSDVIAALQSQINTLLAQIAAITGNAVPNANANASFNRDLETGSVGEDVRALQQWLNANGYTVSSSGPGSPGQETAKFGALTRVALAKMQASVGIKPAAGYFGPKTRAYIASH